MYKFYHINEKHLNDWISMMLELWDDNSYEVLKAEHVNIIYDSNFGNFICYDENDEAVGFINMSLRNDYVPGAENYPVGFVEGIFVKSKYRNRGVARKLLEEGETWARKNGCRQVGSDCELNNLISYDFHIHTGFAETERVVCFIKDLK